MHLCHNDRCVLSSTLLCLCGGCMFSMSLCGFSPETATPSNSLATRTRSNLAAESNIHANVSENSFLSLHLAQQYELSKFKANFRKIRNKMIGCKWRTTHRRLFVSETVLYVHQRKQVHWKKEIWISRSTFLSVSFFFPHEWGQRTL